MSTWCTTTFWNLKKLYFLTVIACCGWWIAFPYFIESWWSALYKCTCLKRLDFAVLLVVEIPYTTVQMSTDFHTGWFSYKSLPRLVAFHLCTHTCTNWEQYPNICALKVCHRCWSLEFKSVLNARWNSTLGQCDVLKSPYTPSLHWYSLLYKLNILYIFICICTNTNFTVGIINLNLYIYE